MMNPRATRGPRPLPHGAATRAARGVLGIGAVGTLVFALGACSSDDTGAQAPADDGAASVTTTTAQPATPAGQSSPAATTAPSGAATTAGADAEARNAAALAAIKTAQDAVGGTAYGIDDEDDNQTWEVDVLVDARSIEVEVSGDGRTAQGQQSDDADDSDQARLSRARTTLEQGIEAALSEVPGALDDVELDEKDDVDVWEVTIDAPDGNDIEVYVATDDSRTVAVER